MPATAQASEVPTLVIPPTRNAPKIARDFLANCFCDLGIADDYVGRVAISELVTNVRKHVKVGQIVVRIFADERDACVVVEVEDVSGRRPVIKEVGAGAQSGRGLFMMSKLVREWGVRPTNEGGKIVWIKLDR